MKAKSMRASREASREKLQDRVDSILEERKTWLTKVRHKKKQQSEIDEMKECCFVPKINDYSKVKRRTLSDLSDWSQLVLVKRENERAEKSKDIVLKRSRSHVSAKSKEMLKRRSVSKKKGMKVEDRLMVIGRIREKKLKDLQEKSVKDFFVPNKRLIEERKRRSQRNKSKSFYKRRGNKDLIKGKMERIKSEFLGDLEAKIASNGKKKEEEKELEEVEVLNLDLIEERVKKEKSREPIRRQQVKKEKSREASKRKEIKKEKSRERVKRHHIIEEKSREPSKRQELKKERTPEPIKRQKVEEEKSPEPVKLQEPREEKKSKSKEPSKRGKCKEAVKKVLKKLKKDKKSKSKEPAKRGKCKEAVKKVLKELKKDKKKVKKEKKRDSSKNKKLEEKVEIKQDQSPKKQKDQEPTPKPEEKVIEIEVMDEPLLHEEEVRFLDFSSLEQSKVPTVFETEKDTKKSKGVRASKSKKKKKREKSKKTRRKKRSQVLEKSEIVQKREEAKNRDEVIAKSSMPIVEAAEAKKKSIYNSRVSVHSRSSSLNVSKVLRTMVKNLFKKDSAPIDLTKRSRPSGSRSKRGSRNPRRK